MITDTPDMEAVWNDVSKPRIVHGKQRKILLQRLSFTPQAFLDNQCEMHFGIGIPEDLPRWSGR